MRVTCEAILRSKVKVQGHGVTKCKIIAASTRYVHVCGGMILEQPLLTAAMVLQRGCSFTRPLIDSTQGIRIFSKLACFWRNQIVFWQRVITFIR